VVDYPSRRIRVSRIWKTGGDELPNHPDIPILSLEKYAASLMVTSLSALSVEGLSASSVELASANNIVSGVI
jgi:hypothetical protein